MISRDIIVIGASAGGWEAIPKLCRGFPADFKGSVFIVWHLSDEGLGLLPDLIMKESKLPAVNASDGEAIEPGKIYVAPPKRHLVIEDGIVRTTAGPKENRFRPAIDPLFRSAAYYYKERVIGIILTGLLNDGTSGLWSIKDNGGIVIAQEPSEAFCSAMPLSAIGNVDVDFILSVEDMIPIISDFQDKTAEAGNYGKSTELLKHEIDMAKEKINDDGDMQKIGAVSEFTCPECHGSLWKMHEGNILRFRCRTGHAYTAESYMIELENTIENYLWSALRGVEESTSLMKHLGEHLTEKGIKETGEEYLDKSREASKKAMLLRQILISKEMAVKSLK